MAVNVTLRFKTTPLGKLVESNNPQKDFVEKLEEKVAILKEKITRTTSAYEESEKEHKETVASLRSKFEASKAILRNATDSLIASKNTSLTTSLDEPPSLWRKQIAYLSPMSVFDTETLSDERLNFCHPDPDLEPFDAYRNDGKVSKSLYSNPSFFFEEWLTSKDKKKSSGKVKEQSSVEPELSTVSSEALSSKKVTEGSENVPSVKQVSEQLPLPPEVSAATTDDMPPPPPTISESPAELEKRLPPLPSHIEASMPPLPKFEESPPAIPSLPENSYSQDSASLPPELPPSVADAQINKQPLPKDKEEPLGSSSLSVPPPPLPSIPNGPPEEGMPPLVKRRSEVVETPALGESAEPIVSTEKPKVPNKNRISNIDPKTGKNGLQTPPIPAPVEKNEDEKSKEEREDAINDMLAEIQKKKAQMRKVETKVEESRGPKLSPFEEAIQNVNRSKMRKVETKDESVTGYSSNNNALVKNKGIFDVLALRSAMHEDTEEDEYSDDQDWS